MRWQLDPEFTPPPKQSAAPDNRTWQPAPDFVPPPKPDPRLEAANKERAIKEEGLARNKRGIELETTKILEDAMTMAKTVTEFLTRNGQPNSSDEAVRLYEESTRVFTPYSGKTVEEIQSDLDKSDSQ
ncbi:hypothetical protein ACB087_00560 [Vibrio sp. VNB-15]